MFGVDVAVAGPHWCDGWMGGQLAGHSEVVVSNGSPFQLPAYLMGNGYASQPLQVPLPPSGAAAMCTVLHCRHMHCRHVQCTAAMCTTLPPCVLHWHHVHYTAAMCTAAPSEHLSACRRNGCRGRGPPHTALLPRAQQGAGECHCCCCRIECHSYVCALSDGDQVWQCDGEGSCNQSPIETRRDGCKSRWSD